MREQKNIIKTNSTPSPEEHDNDIKFNCFPYHRENIIRYAAAAAAVADGDAGWPYTKYYIIIIT
jgi:hypothetical protein